MLKTIKNVNEKCLLKALIIPIFVVR